MIRSVPHLVAVANGKTCEEDHCCYYCGAPCGAAHTIKEWVKPTFTARSSVVRPGSDYVCVGCVISLRQDADIVLLDGETRTGQKSQGYSWVIGGGLVRAATKAHLSQLRAVCLEPPEPPYAIVLSDSGQKHLLYLGAVGRSRDPVVANLEGEPIRYSPDQLRDRLDLCGRLVAATGKPALAEAVDPRFAAAVMEYHRDGETLVERWEKIRTEPLSRLAGWLIPRKEDCKLVYPSDTALAEADGRTDPAPTGGTGGPEPKRRRTGGRRRDEGDGVPTLFDLG